MRFSFFIILFLLFSCQESSVLDQQKETMQEVVREDSVVFKEMLPTPNFSAVADSNFVNLEMLATDIVLDIRYADTNNFTGIQIYDCAACFLQKDAASALWKAQKLAQEKDLSLKVFDCYRAYDHQVKLYEAFPDLNYVAKPSKGSMHSLGCAIDLTLVDNNGRELEMGTSFDSFDKKSYTYSEEIDSIAKHNRLLLQSIMFDNGFAGIKTEWWHFSLKSCNKNVKDNLKWSCPE